MKNIITGSEEDPHIIEKGRNVSIWYFLEYLFISIGGKSGERLKKKHSLFQSLLSMKNDSEDAKIFLERRGYRFVSEFQTLESFQKYIDGNPEAYKQIKSGMHNLGLTFVGFTPSSIVIAYQIEPDKKIHDHMTVLGEEISNSIKDIIL